MVIALSLLPACHPPVVADPEAHNILVVLLDDAGQDKVAAYGMHPDPPRTPHIDALAREGLRFTQAWSYPTCSPTRAALLTGQHVRRTGIGGRLTPNLSPWELVVGEAVTLPQILPPGWDSSIVGKWHLSAGTLGDDPAHHPNDHGFGWSEGTLGNLVVSLTADVPADDRGYTAWEEIRNGEVSWKDRYATREVVDDALDRAARMQEPWLLWVAVPSVHTPLHTPPPDLYDGPEPTTEIAQVDAMVEAMDAEIGRLLDGLDPDVRARTHVFLIGDNGTESHGIAPPLDPFRDKGTVYEGGVRVPLIVSGPAIVGPAVTDALVHVVDLLPTVAALIGADVDDLELDGHSWLPVFDDPSDPGSEVLFVEQFGPNGPGPYTSGVAAVRDRDHKYVRLFDGRESLYSVGPHTLDEGADRLADPEPLTDAEVAAWDRLSAYLDAEQARLDPQ